MTSRQLVAGSADIRVLSGGPVEVTVMGVSPGVDPRTLLAGPVLPGDGHHRTGIFSIAGFGADNLRYALGSDDATVVLGDTDPTPPNVTPSAGGHDYGDYGVVHTIAVTLEQSHRGTGGGVPVRPADCGSGARKFSGRRQPRRTSAACGFRSKYQITAFDLAAGSVVTHVVQTMTDGGSFYPVRLGVTRDRSGPSAPPINAPDGCFPKTAGSREPMNADGEPKVILLVRLLNAIDQGSHSFEALKERSARAASAPSTRSLRRYLAILTDAGFPALLRSRRERLPVRPRLQPQAARP